MKRLLKSHTGYYLSLGLMLLVCFGLIILVSSQPILQTVVILFTAILYVMWGVAHHFVNHDISVKVMVEYILTAALGMMLALLVSR